MNKKIGNKKTEIIGIAHIKLGTYFRSPATQIFSLRYYEEVIT